MANKNKPTLSARSKSKLQKLENNDRSLKGKAGALSRRRKKTSPKKSRLGGIKGGNRTKLKAEKDFILHAKSHPELKGLNKHLSYLGLSFEEFLAAIDLKKFLSTNYNPKGTIFEVFVFNDKVLVKILRERADGSFFNLTFFSKSEIDLSVGNGAKKQFNLKNFENLKTVKATGFKTMPDNKLYLDYAMVRYDPKAKNLFVLVPGEVKEPKAASELKKQFGEFVRRLENTDEIKLRLENREITVESGNVFYLKDNFVGLARRKNELSAPSSGKNVSEKTPIMEIVNLNLKLTEPKGKFAEQEFFRFLIKMNPELNPDKIQKALIEIKTKRLKLKHKN